MVGLLFLFGLREKKKKQKETRSGRSRIFLQIKTDFVVIFGYKKLSFGNKHYFLRKLN